MGTRADFYIGCGKTAEWLGSIAFDGYPDGNPREYKIFDCKTEQEFREHVTTLLKSEDTHSTFPEQGWPWPWEDSGTTDFAYTFDEGKVWASCFGHKWYDPLTEEYVREGNVEFPDMTKVQNVAWDKRSGFLIIQSR